MNKALASVQEAQAACEDFRKNDPKLYYLGGITKPFAVGFDPASEDWVLVGERDPKMALTLDDWVVARRARFL